MKISMRVVQAGFMGCLLLAGSVPGAMAQATKSDTKNGAKKVTATNKLFVGTERAYCTSTGGLVEVRYAVFGTNGPFNTWLPLAGVQGFCQYTSSVDGSRIHVDLTTLYTQKPTLAALAYYAAVPWNGQGDGTPASFYCTQLGGSDQFGGTNASGGGWVEISGIDQVLEACIFPDNSTIDSWGLFYHSDQIIRGIDLSTVLQYANPYAAAKKE